MKKYKGAALASLLGVAMFGVGHYIATDQSAELSAVSSDLAKEKQNVENYRKVISNLGDLREQFLLAQKQNKTHSLLSSLEQAPTKQLASSVQDVDNDEREYNESRERLLNLLAFDTTVSEEEKDDLLDLLTEKKVIDDHYMGFDVTSINARYLEECRGGKETAKEIFQCTAKKHDAHMDEYGSLGVKFGTLGFYIMMLSMTLFAVQGEKQSFQKRLKYKH